MSLLGIITNYNMVQAKPERVDKYHGDARLAFSTPPSGTQDPITGKSSEVASIRQCISPNLRQFLRNPRMMDEAALDTSIARLSAAADLSVEKRESLTQQLVNLISEFDVLDDATSRVISTPDGEEYVEIAAPAVEALRREILVKNVLSSYLDKELTELGSDLLSAAFGEYGLRVRRVYVEVTSLTPGNSTEQIVVEEISSGRNLGRSFLGVSEAAYGRYLGLFRRHGAKAQ